MAFLDLFRFGRSTPSPASPPTASDPAKVKRSDGWFNSITGIGTGRDKMQSGEFMPDLLLTWTELGNLYYGDDIAATIVDAPVQEAFRKGYTLKAEDIPEASDLDKWVQTTYQLNERVAEAQTWARVFGGSLLVFGADDGQPLDQPLNPNAVKSVPWVFPVDRRYVMASTYVNELGPNLGKVDKYLVSFQSARSTQTLTVHSSRCVRFGAIKVDPIKARTLQGWDQSVLQRPYEVLRMFTQAMQGTALMVSEASQGVFKLNGLLDMIAAGEKSALLERMSMVDLSRSVARAILVDSETESFEKVATSFAGIPEVLDRFMQRLSASCGIPVSILMGRSAAGMNATGELDVNSWFTKVGQYQAHTLAPRLLECYRLLSLDKSAPTSGVIPEGLALEWKPLSVPSDKEDAEAYKTRADADIAYISAGVFDPAAVAIARAGRGTYATDVPTVNVERLESELETKASFELPADPAAPGVEQAPAAAAHATPKIVLTASDLAAIVTVNEARAANGLPPLAGPDGSLMLVEFKAKHSGVIAEAAAATAGKSIASSAPPPEPPAVATEGSRVAPPESVKAPEGEGPESEPEGPEGAGPDSDPEVGDGPATKRGAK